MTNQERKALLESQPWPAEVQAEIEKGIVWIGRLEQFLALKDDAWYGKLYRKLSQADLDHCLGWISLNNDLDHGSFALAVERMFLEKHRPPKWAIMQELVSCSNKKE